MIYLDANATTPIDPLVLDRMNQVAQTAYGNPGSTHPVGRQARQAMDEARAMLCQLVQCQPSEFIVTSGGTESNNLALFGLASTIDPRKRCVAYTGGEHPAAIQVIDVLEKRGWGKVQIPLRPNGLIDDERVGDIPWESVGLVSLVYAHNETGVILDLETIRHQARSHGALIHIDAVQAIGRIPVSFHELDVDAMSLGAHKMHGPRGVGALILKEGIAFSPQLVGGYQESGRRPGTEAVSLLAGWAQALKLWDDQKESITLKLRKYRDYLEMGLEQTCSPVVIHGREAARLPNTLNIAFPGVSGESLMVALDLKGVCCSLGSACASGSVTPSPVLMAMGVDQSLASSSLRLSLHRMLTEKDIAEAVQIIGRVVNRLREKQSRQICQSRDAIDTTNSGKKT